MSVAFQRTGLSPSGLTSSQLATGFILTGGSDSSPLDLIGPDHRIVGGIPTVDVGPIWLSLDVVELDGSWVKTWGNQHIVAPSPSPSSAEWGIRNGQIVRKVGSLWRKIGAELIDAEVLFSASEPGAFPPNNRHTSSTYRIRDGQAQFDAGGGLWFHLTCQVVDDEYIFDWTI